MDDRITTVLMVIITVLLAGILYAVLQPRPETPRCLAPYIPDRLSVKVESGQGTIDESNRTVQFQSAVIQEGNRSLIGVLRIELIPGSDPCLGSHEIVPPPPPEFYYRSVANDITLYMSGSLDSAIYLSVYRFNDQPIPLGYPCLPVLPGPPQKIAQFGIQTDSWEILAQSPPCIVY